MFIGHFAVALGAKRAAPAVSLGTLFIACQFVDLLWPILTLLGIEHVRLDPGNTAMTPLDFYDYPYSHSLVAGLVWAAAFGALVYLIRRSWKESLVIGGVTFSHWILDFLTHRPDLPLAPGSDTFFGLGLWNSPWATVIVETALYAAGIWVYARATRAKRAAGNYGLWGLLLLLAVIYTANILGPPPPDTKVIAFAGIGGWLFVLWAYWVDRARVSFPVSSNASN